MDFASVIDFASVVSEGELTCATTSGEERETRGKNQVGA